MKPSASYPKLATLVLATSAVVMLSGCSAMLAQNPSSAFTPVNAVAAEPESRLLLKGADVVAYFTQGQYVQGSPEFRSQHQGVDFRFASAEHKALFDQNPAQYLPQYGGYCANGIVYGIPWGGDADTWKMIDGKLYIFGGKASQEAFELDTAANIALAQRYWDDEVKGSNSFIQRGKRLVFKVPHYQSGEQLAQAVAAAKATGAAPTKP
jgi:YHS domain-containing protein